MYKIQTVNITDTFIQHNNLQMFEISFGPTANDYEVILSRYLYLSPPHLNNLASILILISKPIAKKGAHT